MIGYRIKVGKYFDTDNTFAPKIGLFDLADEWDLEALAKEACEDFQENHDGWEIWREGDVDLELYDPKTEKTLLKCKVSLVFEPSYEVWGIQK